MRERRWFVDGVWKGKGDILSVKVGKCLSCVLLIWFVKYGECVMCGVCGGYSVDKCNGMVKEWGGWGKWVEGERVEGRLVEGFGRIEGLGINGEGDFRG